MSALVIGRPSKRRCGTLDDVAVRSYLEERAGGMVAAGVFATDEEAVAALRALHDIGLRWQDLTVLATDAGRAATVARVGEAWTPKPAAFGLPFPRRLPNSIRSRYGSALAAGRVVIVAAANDQPEETVAAVLAQAKATEVQSWWQEPSDIFAPPEEGGPL